MACSDGFSNIENKENKGLSAASVKQFQTKTSDNLNSRRINQCMNKLPFRATAGESSHSRLVSATTTRGLTTGRPSEDTRAVVKKSSGSKLNPVASEGRVANRTLDDKAQM